MGKTNTGGKASGKGAAKSKSSSKSGKGSANPAKPSVDKHPGAHDTKSKSNPTLTESGAQKLGHGLPAFTPEQLSKRGADKELGKLYARKYKNKKQ